MNYIFVFLAGVCAGVTALAVFSVTRKEAPYPASLLKALARAEYALWVAKEWSWLHNGPLYSLTITANSAHADLITAINEIGLATSVRMVGGLPPHNGPVTVKLTPGLASKAASVGEAFDSNSLEQGDWQ